MVRKLINIITVIVVISIVTVIAVGILIQPHDHKVYNYPLANGVKPMTFIICGDSTLVTKDNGTHIGFIPEHLESYTKEKYRLK